MDNTELRQECDTLKWLLINACKILFGSSNGKGGFAMPDKDATIALAEWWMKHVRTNRPNNKLREKALAKLTSEERQILGLTK